MVTDVLLVYQAILVSVSRVVLHLDIVNEILFSLVLLVGCLGHASSVWRLVDDFWS